MGLAPEESKLTTAETSVLEILLLSFCFVFFLFYFSRSSHSLFLFVYNGLRILTSRFIFLWASGMDWRGKCRMRDFIMHAAHCFFCFYHLFVSFLFLLLFFNLISCPSTTPYGKKLPIYYSNWNELEKGKTGRQAWTDECMDAHERKHEYGRD